MIRSLLFLFLFVFVVSCGLKEREEALKSKQSLLMTKEKELILKENSLAQKEIELKKLETKLSKKKKNRNKKMELEADSTVADTAIYDDPRITGQWSAKMTCTETTCAGSAVGDTKSETWIFSFHYNQLIAEARTGDKLVRIYTGAVSENNIVMDEDLELSPSASKTKLKVRLSLISNTYMEGRREIIREDDCKIIYSLSLNKQ